jgi:hypothetical protein
LARYWWSPGFHPITVSLERYFSQGKTITVIAGTAPGGIGDNRVSKHAS